MSLLFLIQILTLEIVKEIRGSRILLVEDSKINQQVDNTIILFKRSKIIGKFVNLKPTQDNFKLLSNRLDETINEYFYLH